jgi:hypothetical protein
VCLWRAPDRPSSVVTSRGLSGIAQRQTTPTVSLRRPPDSLVMRGSGVRFPKPVSKLMMLDKVSLTPQPARARRA